MVIKDFKNSTNKHIGKIRSNISNLKINTLAIHNTYGYGLLSKKRFKIKKKMISSLEQMNRELNVLYKSFDSLSKECLEKRKFRKRTSRK